MGILPYIEGTIDGWTLPHVPMGPLCVNFEDRNLFFFLKQRKGGRQKRDGGHSTVAPAATNQRTINGQPKIFLLIFSSLPVASSSTCGDSKRHHQRATLG